MPVMHSSGMVAGICTEVEDQNSQDGHEAFNVGCCGLPFIQESVPRGNPYMLYGLWMILVNVGKYSIEPSDDGRKGIQYIIIHPY